jgi:hypothetical protein
MVVDLGGMFMSVYNILICIWQEKLECTKSNKDGQYIGQKKQGKTGRPNTTHRKQD